MAEALPMFPLGGVLVPRAVLPLHVFEPRYRELARVCTTGRPEFGVVLIERGSEVGGGDVRRDVGCVARVLEATELPDGRWLMTTVGTERIRVQRWLDDAPFPRAVVAAWPDPPAGPDAAARRAELLAALRRALALHAELGEAASPATVDIDDDPASASWEMAAVAPVGPDDRYRLLAAPSPDARFALLEALLADDLEVLARRLAGG